jgi:hypothetical protein
VKQLWRRRAGCSALAAAAVSVVLAALLAGCASDPARTAPRAVPTPSTTGSPTPVAPNRAATTATHVFAAFDSSGAPAAGVEAHRSGTCFASSITVSARGAYRCFAGNRLLDPCFVVPGSAKHTVACFADPWSRAVELQLSATVPKPGAPLKISSPWAMELAGGERCLVTTGTARIVHGVPMRYQCASAETAGLLSTTGKLRKAQVRSAGGALRQVPVLGSWSA